MPPLMSPAPRPHPSLRAPIVVIGATGGVGRGVVAALLEAGTPVLAVARDGERLAALRRASGASVPLGVVPGSVATDAQGAELAGVLRALKRPIGGVVVSISGPRQRARLLEQPADFLTDALQANVLPVLVAARHLVPLLAAAQKRLPFLVLGGPAADVPWAGYGQHSVAASAQRMLVRVLRDELVDQSVRIQQLLVASPVRTEERAHCACPQWPSALEVGRRVRAVLADTHSREAVLRLEPSLRTPPDGAQRDAGLPFDIQEASP